MRKKYVIGNWKMHKNNVEALAFVDRFESLLAKESNLDLIVGVCPGFLSLQMVSNSAKRLLVAAQNCHDKDKGAYTGEISIPMLQEIKIHYSLVGHSERRSYYNETNTSCNLKIKALLAHHLRPIYCVGETLAQYEATQTFQVVATQLKEGLKEVNKNEVLNLIFAYEPVWSIGTGKNASSAIAQSVCAFMRKTLASLYDEETASKISILYGGSVKNDNVAEYMNCEDVDGVLVGGASLEAESFYQLIKQASK